MATTPPGRHRRIFVAALLTLVLACPQARAASDWIEVRSANFTVYTNGGQKAGERLVWQFELIRGLFKKQWSWAKVDGAEPTIIIGAKDEKTLQSFLPFFWELKHAARPAGISIPGLDRHTLIVQLDASDGENPYHILYHEYTHRILGLNFSWLPVWLSEGMAEFFGSTDIDGSDVRQGQPRSEVVQFLREVRLMDLDKFFAVDPTSPEYNEQTRATVFYAQAWAAVHYLILGDKGAHAEQLNGFVRDLAAGAPEGEARKKAFGDPRILQATLKRYVSQPAFFYRKAEDLVDVPPREFKMRALSEAEALARRADVLGRTGQIPLAEEAIENGLKAEGGATLPQLRDLKAQILAGKKKSVDAMVFFTEAERLGSVDFFAAFVAANLALKDDKFTPEAERLFRRSAALNPQSPLAPFTLGTWLGATKGREAESLEWLTKAAELSPLNLPLQLRIAEQLQAIERTDEARSIAERVVRLAQGTLCDSATKFLETAVPKATEKLMAFHLKRCEAGVGDACARAGHMFKEGASGARDDFRAVDMFRKGCALKNEDGCDQFAWHVETGKGIAKDEKKAFEIYEENCTRSAWACAKVASHFWRGGEGAARDGAMAAGFAQKACEAKSGWGCDLLGRIYLQGDGVAKDLERSVTLFESACGLKYAEGCNDLGASYEFEFGPVTEESAGKAFAAYQRGCEAKHAMSCERVGDMLVEGRGAPVDYSKAARAYETACDDGRAGSCAQLAALYSSGEGVTKDPARAVDLFKKACDKDNGFGCYRLARERIGQKDFPAAFGLADRACKIKNKYGCLLLGTLLIQGQGSARDPVRAFGLFDAGCTDGFMEACFALANLYGTGVGVPRDLQKAAMLGQKACEGGVKVACAAGSRDPSSVHELPPGVQTACEAKDAMACIVLGGILFGQGEFVKAAPALETACASGHSWSCSQLATGYLLGGRGVPKDPKRARELFQQACADKEKSACEALGLLR